MGKKSEHKDGPADRPSLSVEHAKARPKRPRPLLTAQQQKLYGAITAANGFSMEAARESFLKQKKSGDGK